ncbi:Helix-turn-helix, type 11 domain protein [Nitrospira sp. KM1]|nr:WYL domain-containing protein [Nitrospira sp. KM1]BCA53157.1 Helix-turn-helix, type 11 domain protein [Nitrospira sp. KM1]
MVRMIRTLCSRGMTRAELEEEFQVDRRHIYDYLQAIEQLGYVFEDHDGTGERLWRIDGGYLGIKPEPASIAELMAFYLAKAHIDYLSGTPFIADLERLSRKIEAGLPEKTAAKIKQMVQVFLPAQRPQRSYAKQNEILSELQKGLLFQRPVRITHRALSYPKPVAHHVEPYGLQLFDYGLYLVGYSDRAKDFRRFAIERIQSAKADMTADPFTVRPEYQQRLKSRKAFGLIEDDVMDVKVQFSKEVADYFKERQWHPTQKVKQLKTAMSLCRFKQEGWMRLCRGFCHGVAMPEF